MASSPEAALPADNNVATASPPAADSSTSLPPLESSPPPPPPPPPPADSSLPPLQPDSPPSSTTPPNDSISPSPVFSPPAPDGEGDLETPPSPALFRSPPRSHSGRPAPPSPSSDYKELPVILGIIFGGLVCLVLILVFLKWWRRRRRNKQQYYLEQGLPHKGGDQYHKVSKQKKKPANLNTKLPASPGVGGRGVPAPPMVGHPSSEFNLGYPGQHPAHVHTPPSVGGFGAKCEFTYEALAAATGGFSPVNLLGQGGFEFVHKGVLPNGKEVAVKSLKSGSGQGEREFQAEVEIISRVHHRHLVSLVGYCISGGQRMLVYEFVPNKTLEFHLHGMSTFLNALNLFIHSL